jgi:hypothetical protein
MFVKFRLALLGNVRIIRLNNDILEFIIIITAIIIIIIIIIFSYYVFLRIPIHPFVSLLLLNYVFLLPC